MQPFLLQPGAGSGLDTAQLPTCSLATALLPLLYCPRHDMSADSSAEFSRPGLVPGDCGLPLSCACVCPLPHLQGIFLDTDGTLLNADNLPADLVANATAAGIALGVANTTWCEATSCALL